MSNSENNMFKLLNSGKKNQKLLLNNIKNGRVNIMNNAVFMLSDNIPVNDNSNFREALTGNWSNTPLSNIFFSNKNINILQNGIRYGVYEKSNNQFIIDKQNTIRPWVIIP